MVWREGWVKGGEEMTWILVEGVLRSGTEKSVFVLSLTRLHAQNSFFLLLLSFRK